MNNQQNTINRIRKRSDERLEENKKQRRSDSDENIMDPASINEAVKNAFENPELISKFTNQFALQCSTLIQKSLKVTNEKVEVLEQTTLDNRRRIDDLEAITDEFEQHQRANNIIVRGIASNDNSKRVIANILTAKTGITVKENDMKFAIKLLTKGDNTSGLESYKVCFFDKKLRDMLYVRRMGFKGTNTYISEDLTLKRSNLAYMTRDYVRKHEGASSWTIDGKVFMKMSPEEKPRLIKFPSDLDANDDGQQ